MSLISKNSPNNLTNRTRYSIQLSTGFVFTNTDSDDVTWGCSLTVIVSVIVGFQNLSIIEHDCEVESIRSPQLGWGIPKDWLYRAGLNTLRPRQDGRHFPDEIFKSIFLNENVWISIKMSLKLVPRCPINNIPALVQIMAWRRQGDKPLSEPMMVSLPTHICVTRPRLNAIIYIIHLVKKLVKLMKMICRISQVYMRYIRH